MTKPDQGVRVTIYLPASLLAWAEEEGWRQRTSRSKFLADVIREAKERQASAVRENEAVLRVSSGGGGSPPSDTPRSEGEGPEGS